jgi:hypothetical protein
MAAGADLRLDDLEPIGAVERGSEMPRPWRVTILVGAAVSALVACVAWWLGVPFVAALAAGGVVAGPLVAVRRAGRLAGPGWLATSIVLGIQAPLLVCLVITAYGIVTSILAALDPDPATANAYWAFAFVLPYGMVFGTPVAVPVSIVAGFLVHRVAGMRPERAQRHVGTLAVAALVASLVTLASASGLLARVVPGAAPVDWAATTAAVRLTLTVENHASSDVSLLADWDEGDGGRSGLSIEAPSCSIVVDRLYLSGSAWSIAAYDESQMEPFATPIASSAGWPGGDPAITIRLAEDGTASVVAGSRSITATDDGWPPERLIPCP